MFKLISVVVLSLALGACPAGETGEACTADGDCESSRCVTGGSFPGGLCTPECNNDSECPEGFSCVSRSSGICLKNCGSDAECESERGTSWQCREESLEAGGGNRNVCIGD